jgi:aryl-alcohol dehydrogenase-like predicted oxidoreductase
LRRLKAKPQVVDLKDGAESDGAMRFRLLRPTSHEAITMHYTTLGHTGLRVSVAGLGTGGFSRLGLRTGKSEDEAARLIQEAVGLGVNVIDTAPSYGTEAVVGRALTSIPRDQVVIATKAQIHRNDEWFTPARVVESLDNSLRLLGTDHVDVFNLHGVEASEYDHARMIAQALLAEKAKGKIRHIGITENSINDFTNAMLARALRDPIWEVVMVGFHMMHQGPRANVFPATSQRGIGTLLMFAVRSIFADPPRVARELKQLAAQGLVEAWLGETDDPLGFLIHEGGAANMTEAAYRYARHEPGVDVVLFGTGDAGHLRANVASLLKPPLPEAERAKLAALFGHLATGVGLDSQQARA